MFKKFLSLLLVVFSFSLSLAGCKKNLPQTSSLIPSKPESSEITSSEIDRTIWGSTSDEKGVIRPTFISSDSEGNIFYCSTSGDIYKKLADGKGLSKVYSSTGYKFFSVQCTEKDEICAGYKKNEKTYGYIIFNLKDKTVRNAVVGSEFEDKTITSLTYYGGRFFFLSNPDRYNRYTLYMQMDGKTTEIAKGVNEFFVLRGRVFYNIGSYVFSASIDISERSLLTALPSNDLLGFTIINEKFFFMTSTNTFSCDINSVHPDMVEAPIKVYTSVKKDNYTFFCGVNGGIYALSTLSGVVFKVSDYTADEIYVNGDWLYLYPANQNEYKDIDKNLLISGGIYRISIPELLEYTKHRENEDFVSSSLSLTETVSSQLASDEIPPPILELFGR